VKTPIPQKKIKCLLGVSIGCVGLYLYFVIIISLFYPFVIDRGKF